MACNCDQSQHELYSTVQLRETEYADGDQIPGSTVHNQTPTAGRQVSSPNSDHIRTVARKATACNLYNHVPAAFDKPALDAKVSRFFSVELQVLYRCYFTLACK